MNVLLDTSVLVAALVKRHPRHEPCREWLAKLLAGPDGLVVAAHSLAELFAVLTRLPLKPRISPATARRLLEENELRAGGRVTVQILTANDYEDVLHRCADRSLSGGIVYDALIAKAAERAGVDLLVTLNSSHFRRAWPEGGERIRDAGR